jgi:hypothetical protein
MQQGAAKPATESKELPGVVAEGLEERHPVPAEDEVMQAEATESKPQTQAVRSNEGQREGAEIVGKPSESTAQKEPAQGQGKGQRGRRSHPGGCRAAGQADEPGW